MAARHRTREGVILKCYCIPFLPSFLSGERTISAEVKIEYRQPRHPIAFCSISSCNTNQSLVRWVRDACVGAEHERFLDLRE